MATQQPLFLDDHALRPRAARGLVLRPQPGSPLNRKQQTFNRLVAKIEKLRARLEADKRRLEDALVFHMEHLRPRVQRMVTLRKDLVRALQPFLDDARLKRGDRRDLRAILAEQLDDVLGHEGSLDDDLQPLFERLHGAGLAELEQEQMEEARSGMEAMFAQLGIDVDLSGLHPGMSDEELAAKAAQMADDMRRQSEQAWSQAGPGRRKSKRARQEDERVHRREELRKASIGTIYRQLAKALHPDLEPDPDSRQHKSALMQELTAAYAANDLHTLLRLELEWLHREEADETRLTDEKLNACNQLLKEQVAELEAALLDLPLDPRYQPLVQDAGPFGFRLQIDGPEHARQLDVVIDDMAAALARLQTKSALQEVRGAIRDHRRAARTRPM